METKNKTIAVGMSGGVDSTVAASILKEEGYNVIGLTMKIWDGPAASKPCDKHACYGPDEAFDIEDTKKAADELGIKLHVIDLSKEYKKIVLDKFKSEYMAGRTPNPCVICNPKMKFGLLVDVARASNIEFDIFATGHYSRIKYDKGLNRYLLKRAKQIEKDQSYFLYSLKQNQLERTILPLGNLSKSEVRNYAKERNLRIAEKPESQDFVSDGTYSELFDDAQHKPGSIINTNGDVLGKHKGIINYTIGQRKGLGISSPKPLHVLKINATNNTIIVGDKDELYSSEFIVSNLNLISIDKISEPLRALVKIRQNNKESVATIYPNDELSVRVKYDEARLSITPGQAAVFYDNDIVIGGGTIDKIL